MKHHRALCLGLFFVILARALYLCGDKDGIGEKILREFATNDVRGLLARHAQAVLESAR